MGKLDGACGYLSGPMEFVADHGVEWRRKFIRLVEEAGLDIDLIDPTDKPGGRDVKIGENQAYQKRLQETGQWKALQEYVHKYRRFDLRFTDNADFLVAVIDPTIPQWGTSNEVYVAEIRHIPIFFVIDGGLRNLPRWLFDVIDDIKSDDPIKALAESNVYETIEAVIQKLIALDKGSEPMNDEWVLMRRAIEDRRKDRKFRAQV